MSTKRKVFIGLGVYLLIVIILGVAFGSSGKNEEFKPQNEFKLESWIPINIAGIDLSINRAVLYLVLAGGLTIFTLTMIARRMEQKPNRVQTAMELAYDLTRNTITGENMETPPGAQVVPVPRDALLLHLVLEHARLHPAADQQRRDGRHLRPRRPDASRSTPRPPTSRCR